MLPIEMKSFFGHRSWPNKLALDKDCKLGTPNPLINFPSWDTALLLITSSLKWFLPHTSRNFIRHYTDQLQIFLGNPMLLGTLWPPCTRAFFIFIPNIFKKQIHLAPLVHFEWLKTALWILSTLNHSFHYSRV